MPQLLAIPAVAAGLGSSGLAALGSGATAIGAGGLGTMLGSGATALGGAASSMGAASGLQGLLTMAGLGTPAVTGGAAGGLVAPIAGSPGMPGLGIAAAGTPVGGSGLPAAIAGTKAKIGALSDKAAALQAKGEQAMAIKNLLVGGPAPEAPPASVRGRARKGRVEAPVVEDTTATSRKDAELEQLINMILGGNR